VDGIGDPSKPGGKNLMATRWFVLLSLILAGTDQVTKAICISQLIPNARYEIVPDFFRLTLNFNKGIAWGMLPEWSEYFTYFAIIMVLVILMIMRKLDKDEVWLKIALAFQMAGAMGNMTDRLTRHQVTDFLDVTLFPHTTLHHSWNLLGLFHGQINLPYDWPIFNLADSFVVVGTSVLVLVLAFARETPPSPVSSTQGLGSIKDRPDRDKIWGDSSNICGTIPSGEALLEIPCGEESEGLVPLEEVESVREDRIGEPPSSDDGKSIPPGPDDKSKLDELSKWPDK
jgi:signal peptidase II